MDGGAVVCDPNNSSVLYTGGWYYNGTTYVMAVSKSTDGGANWTRSEVSTDYNSCYALLVDKTNSNIVYSAGMTGLYKSTNAGATWFASYTGLTGTVNDLAMGSTKANIIYAATTNGVFKSTNAGASWTNTGCSGVNAVLINPNNENEIYAATRADGVYKSTNGGGGWTAMNNGLGNLNTTCLGIYPNNYLFVSTYGSGMYRSSLIVGAVETGGDRQKMLFSACPNPGSGPIAVQYELNQAGPVRLRIFDLQGRSVKELVHADQTIGLHSAAWNGKDQNGIRVPNGVYFCKLDAGDQNLVQKLIIVE